MSEFRLENVRVRFCHLFTPWQGKFKDSEPKYNLSTILEPTAADVIALKNGIDKLAMEAYGVKSLSPEKYCLRLGDHLTKPTPEVTGKLVLASNRRAESGRPVVIYGNGTVCEQPENNPIYGGCYANIKVSIWAQDPKTYGPRINCDIIAIQFAGDGEPLSAGHIDKDKVAAEFGAVPGATDNAANAAPTQQAPAAAINQFG